MSQESDLRLTKGTALGPVAGSLVGMRLYLAAVHVGVHGKRVLDPPGDALSWALQGHEDAEHHLPSAWTAQSDYAGQAPHREGHTRMSFCVLGFFP